jgi:O-antigen/teichoic acid export membrane protein
MERLLRAGTGKIFWDVSSRALSFALSVLVARKLGAEGFGTFAVVWYAAWMLSQSTDLGLHLVTLRSLSRGAPSSALFGAVAVKGVVTAVIVLATVSIAGGGSVVALLLAAHLACSWVELAGVVLRSQGLIAREGLLLTALRSSWLLGAVWVLSRGASVELLASVLALSGLPALGLAAAWMSRSGLVSKGPWFDRAETVRLFREILPLAVGSVLTLLYLRVDLLVVAFLRGSTEAGLFQSAFRIFEATFVFSGGIAAGTFPILASRVGKSGFEGSARFVLVLLLSVAAPLACLFAFGAEPILGVLYGNEFLAASGPLAILGLGIAAVFANALATHLLVASGRSRRYVLAMVVRLLVALALDFLLVPSWGALGAAVAVAVAEWSLAVVTLASVADLLAFSPPRGRSLSPKAASS